MKIGWIKIRKLLKKLLKNKKVTLSTILGAALFVFFFFFIVRDIPSPTKLGSPSVPQATQIFDRNGKLLYSIYTSKNQTFIPLATIPKHMQQATISIEDRSFYKHGALDIKGILRAAYSIVVRKELQGGSTLTQQLVKTSLLSPERTVARKIKEVLLAFATEAIYPKSKIIEMYLNQVPYGGTAYGVEAAAQTYFGKSAKELTLGQSALLAGLPEAPTTYSPFGAHPELSRRRQEEVLKAMYEEGYITRDEQQKALKEKVELQKVSNNIKAPHFVLYIKDLLTEKYGQKAVEEGGLRVTTSLDLELQEYAQASVSAEVSKLRGYNVSNAAATIANPKTGEILAMVGSKDYFDTSIDGNVNIALARRQPGSSIKPINYAVGLMEGYTAATPFIDNKICFPNIAQPPYCPVNYDEKFHGVVQVRFALANSINIPAVKMLKLNGVNAMIATASAMGINTFTEKDRYGLSLTLGGGEVTMLDMTTAFSVFANSGYRVNLHPILKVIDSKGKILENYKPLASPIFGAKVLPESVSFIISNILSDNNARAEAFGTNSPLRIGNYPVAVKTGTTNDFRDNWTIGYTPSYVVAVWVGNNNNRPMSGLVSGITGAAPIWHSLMAHLVEGDSAQPFQRPPNVIQKSVCSVSGLLPPKEGCSTRFEYFIAGTEPKTAEKGKEKVLIDKNTNTLAQPGQTENVEEREMQLIKDALGDTYCVGCSHPDEAAPTPTPG
ncbi:MAG: penicillin-binding protein [Candidatus Levybacteria bacterium]|nr:penicillin-binding protein [Candidatus Levybacteria bacterium]